MEERRLAGARLLKAGKLSQAQIARELGVSRASVSDWAKQLAAGGIKRLRRRRAPGRTPRLNPEERKALVRHLKGGARAAGFRTERWTLQRVQQLVERKFGVTYHPNSLNRVLRRLGWTRQVPLPRAVERDEDLVRAWLEQDWPRIKKGAAKRRGNRVLR